MAGYVGPSTLGVNMNGQSDASSAAAPSSGPTAWQATTPDALASSVQGYDSLYLTASQQKAWQNNLVYLGQDATPSPKYDSNDPDARRKATSYAQQHNQPGGFYKTPEDFLQGIEHQSSVASEFAAQAASKGMNPKDMAYGILSDPKASDSQKAMAGAWMGFASLQDELNQAGFYTSSNGPLLGGGRLTDYQALGAALEQYFREQGDPTTNQNPNPMTFSEFLQNHKTVGNQNGYPGASGPGGGSTTPFNPSSPDVISQQGDAMAQSELGHSLNQDQTNSLIGQVQGQEASAFSAGDTYLRGVTPQSLAREFIVDNNLPEYASHQAEGFMNVFANMFLGGNSQRANTSLGDVAIGGK